MQEYGTPVRRNAGAKASRLEGVWASGRSGIQTMKGGVEKRLAFSKTAQGIVCI